MLTIEIKNEDGDILGYINSNTPFNTIYGLAEEWDNNRARLGCSEYDPDDDFWADYLKEKKIRNVLEDGGGIDNFIKYVQFRGYHASLFKADTELTLKCS